MIDNGVLDEHGLVNTIKVQKHWDPVSRYNWEKGELVHYVFSSCASCAALVNVRECT